MPKQLGKRWYLREDSTRKSGYLYKDDYDEKEMPKTSTFCVNLFKRKPVEGHITIKYYY